MIAEALKQVSEQAVKAHDPKTVFESRREKIILLPGGPESFDKDNPSRAHGVDTLADLIALANRFQEEDGGNEPVVWYDENKVVLVINDDGLRDDYAELTLELSGLYKAIAGLNPSTWYPPKDFIRLLRINLYGALEPQVLLNPVRRVKFESGSTTHAENVKGKESMGREISASVSAASELPEYVTLVTPIYTNPGANVTVSIKAAVESDPTRQAFQIVVLPDELENAKAHVMRALADVLGTGLNTEIPAYQGRPQV